MAEGRARRENCTQLPRQLDLDTLSYIVYWKNRHIIRIISLAKDNNIKGRLIDGISAEAASGDPSGDPNRKQSSGPSGEPRLGW